ASAVDSIAAMGDEAEAFLDPLCKLFNDKSSQVRCAAVKAVAGCGELGQMYASEVCRLTGNADAKTRAAAIHALTEMGERGACFDDEVEMCLSDPDPFVASAAQKALQHFQGVKMAAAAALQDLSKPLKPQILGARSSDLTELEAPPAAGANGSTQPLAALLFPGQGSQYVKMLSEVKDLPSVQEMLSTAHTILGYDILKLCLEGPEETLEQTKHCQPAMYIGGLAAFELLKKENPKVAEQFQAVAGLSLGEYTALPLDVDPSRPSHGEEGESTVDGRTVAGVMDFETGLRLVKFRGEAMQEAAEASPQKMISVAGLSQQVLEQLCSECRSGPDDVCQVANFLFPNGFSCAGSESACEKLLKKAGDTQGCLQAKALKTSGAFHTKCMAPARSKLLTALKDAESKMKPPNCEVYVNLTGQKIPPGTSVPRIIELLADQLTNCVLWEPAMKAMVNDGISEFYECGPMKQLKAMMKRIDGDAWKKTQNIHV
ncbi:Malonyl-CoA-acyl carrier protein transacylase, partial [Durusdinium trenchii]